MLRELRRDRTKRNAWGRPLRSVPTTHIFKPAMAGLEDHDINEHLCLTAASAIGFPDSNAFDRPSPGRWR